MSTMIVCGRLGRDAELRTTSSGTKVAGFSIADEIGWGDKKRVQWIKCAMFGERAEKIAQYLTKGSMVEVVGTPTVESWTGKDGKTSAAISVTVSEVKLHGGGSDRSEAPKRQASQDEMNQDIPF